MNDEPESRDEPRPETPSEGKAGARGAGRGKQPTFAPTTPPPPSRTTRGEREPQHQQFLDAWRDYERSLQEACQDAWLRSQEAWRDHVTRLQRIQMDAQKDYQESYRIYLRSVQESSAGEEVRHRAREARHGFQDAVRKVQQTGQKDWEEAQHSYRESAEHLQDELRQRVQDSWRDYVRALQKAWSQIDVDQIEADELAMVTQSLTAAVRLEEHRTELVIARKEDEMYGETAHHDEVRPPKDSRRRPVPSLEPVYNERGVIAENYHDLQGLGVLEAARAKYPLPKASHESTVRALFQGVEIGLVNLNDIVGRAVADLEAGEIRPAMVKMFWARGFHRVLSSLSLVPGRLGTLDLDGRPRGVLRIGDSPAFREYLATLRRLDAAVAGCTASGTIRMAEAVADRSLDDPALHLLHLIRVGNHESTIWEANLAEVPVPVPVPSYEELVVADGMRAAVYDRVLKGDTYFTQFRGLHQIPETLGEEANDHCEQAILDLRAGRLRQAADRLARVNVLAETMITALPPMADSLVTSDYHEIRENLGLTSGSHSVCLRYHMFTDLYEQLGAEIEAQLTGRPAGEAGGEEIAAAVRRSDGRRFEDERSWLLSLLTTQCLALRTSVFHWRDQHLNMPRNNLGGDFTKSLTGSADAIRAVKQMRAAARAKDPMIPLVQARGLTVVPPAGPAGELGRYLDSEESLDSQLLVATGRATQARFHEVQERLGFFANRCPFSPPPRREV